MKTKQDASAPANGAHTPGPWKILAEHGAKNAFAEKRFIATDDAEFSGDSPSGEDYLMSGSLICAMRDGPPANAHLIAAAPELLAALRLLIKAESMQLGARDGCTMGQISTAIDAARTAIAKAEGRA